MHQAFCIILFKIGFQEGNRAGIEIIFFEQPGYSKSWQAKATGNSSKVSGYRAVLKLEMSGSGHSQLPGTGQSSLAVPLEGAKNLPMTGNNPARIVMHLCKTVPIFTEASIFLQWIIGGPYNTGWLWATTSRGHHYRPGTPAHRKNYPWKRFLNTEIEKRSGLSIIRSVLSASMRYKKQRISWELKPWFFSLRVSKSSLFKSLNRNSERIPRTLLRGKRANQKLDIIPYGGRFPVDSCRVFKIECQKTNISNLKWQYIPTQHNTCFLLWCNLL